MAEQQDDIQVAEEKKAKTAKLLLVVIAVLLLAVIALGVFMLTGGNDTKEPTRTESAARPDPIYYSIDDPFIVNFSEQSNGAVRYLQVKMKLMARSQAVIDKVKMHLPAIQHELLVLLYSQKYDDLQSSEGTRALQQACLQTINRIIQSETSMEDELEAVYFTSFIMQ